MKTALTIYVTICLLCPIFNYQKDKPIQEEIEVVEFWCDGGVDRDWETNGYVDS